MSGEESTQRWAARPFQAGLIRFVVFAVPIAGSILFVHFASAVVSVPTSSFILFGTWWVLMSAAATVVLWAIDRVARRLLPLVALYKLSLVFPDAAPSRFRLALGSNNVETLEERVAQAKALDDSSTPIEAAELLLALVAELDSHDPLTRGHSDRVRAYAQMIGKELHVSASELDHLNWAALLHDVGKLSVPTEILAKPGRPNDEEWAVLRRHPEFGAALVAPLQRWLGDWARAVPEHHERWDGKGYPAGLAAEEIALGGRIVAVADVFDVITSARSYKSAFASTAARDEIAQCAGTQFDPRVVRAFLNISLGRLRLVMGPLSWLAHAPLLARLPLTPALGTVGASLGTVAVALSGGLISTPPEPGLANTGTEAALTSTAPAPIERVLLEDQDGVVNLERARGGASVRSLEVLEQPAVGRARVTTGRQLAYSPPPNFHGRVVIRYRACWSGRDCREGVVRIAVIPVNDRPTARDDRARTAAGVTALVTVLENDSDPDGDALSLSSVSALTGGRARIKGNQLEWVPPERFRGTARLRYAIVDGHGGAARAMVTIDVASAISRRPPPMGVPPTGEPDNKPTVPAPSGAGTPEPPAADEPPVARADRVSVPEGGTVIVDVLANDDDPDGDPLSLVSVGSVGHGRARLLGDRVEYSAPSDYVGRVSVPYTITDPKGATAHSTVAISVLLVNAPPVFTPGSRQSVPEDSGAHTVGAWARHISPGATSEAGQTVSFSVTNDNPRLFSAEPQIAPNGTLSYTPAANANGTALVTVRAHDDGGTANGGVDTSPAQTFGIAVTPVNDVPSFAPGADQVVSEDGGAQSVSGWATRIDAGAANEAGQGVSFIVSTDDRVLFASGGEPRVGADGTLAYRSAANAVGKATVTIRVHDDGGTADGGIDTGPALTFTIAIRAVNDPPAFTGGSGQTVLEDVGLQTVAGWAKGISPGPADEASQTVGFLVDSDKPSLFSRQPGVAGDGTLTYTPAANANGTATVSVRGRDDGGTANGGVDTSAAQTFTITMTPVDDAPVANADAATAVEDDVSGVTFNVLANDSDVDAGDTLSVSSYDGSTVANGTLTANGGGSFTYVPDGGFTGTETFSYVVSDSLGATSSASATITVNAVPHAPIAGNDAYATTQDTPVVVGAPGVLGNDGDQDGDPLTVQTSLVSAPSDGAVSLGADGSFTYTPNSGFTGSDSFTYRIDDGTGRSADAVVTITVTASVSGSSTLYLQSTGATSDLWDMSLALPPAVPSQTDFDGDGKAGLTIKDSDGKETVNEGAKYQTWTYTAPGPLLLNGPVNLDLWSSTGLFVSLKSGTIYTYLYSCGAGGILCTKIASNAVFNSPWNNSLLSWSHRVISIGSVNTTIPAGNELRVKVLFHATDLWVTMTAAFPSALVVTLG